MWIKNEDLIEKQNQLRSQIHRLAKQIRSKETVAKILEDDNFDYYELVESKPDRPGKGGTTTTGKAELDPKMLKDNELMKRRNEHMMQILLEFENENKLLEKGLVEIDEQIKKLNLTQMKSSKGGNRFGKENIIKCPSLEKFLSVCAY